MRPQRALQFFHAFAVEEGLLPAPFTAEELATEWAQEILNELFGEHSYRFPDLQSPRAASDTSLSPDLKNGFSFTINKALVQTIGSSPVNNGTNGYHQAPRPMAADTSALLKRIEAARMAAGAKNGTDAGNNSSTEKKKS